MENRVTINNQQLIIEPQGLDKVWAVKRQLSILLDHISGATIDEGIFGHLVQGFQNPGTAIPGIYYAGTFYLGGDKTFFNIKRTSKPVVIQLHDEDYDRIVIGVENPRHLVDQINNSIKHKAGKKLQIRFFPALLFIHI
ncbi:hypothetical protein LG045_08220 [Limosilactobacillus gastricus]|uniref:Bacterial Pleckstrin homology domain-containing protein n=1 Tax=Limosilactobacillus gastricus DSM 16045 TaxID=1423749 RepID=A0A0R1VE16_9LACO|nr:hypothetical protein [Limosilactobacillus gastricus]KRM01481.1 hypothetical protein FC60_GL000614 [Limosilactobacillus gastricus DSM 16045]QGF41023.1 hypothetical protein LG045_08220 [Limosilactobacillus gastricus]